MPKNVERALRKAAKKQGLIGKKANNFVYGTMTNMMKKGEIKWKRGK